MTVPIYRCICDTNIWVRVCLGNVHETYIRNFRAVGIADVVKNEIVKWKSHEGRFQDIYNHFVKYEKKDILIINKESIDPLTKKIIDRELLLWGFPDLDNSTKTIDNLGEFVSLLYAYHLGIPYIHTHDLNFYDTIQVEEIYAQYKGIQMMTWNELSEHITDNFSERLALTKRVEKESDEMTKKYKKSKKEQSWENKLNDLQKHFSRR